MRYYVKRALSTMLAVALLGCAAMLSVSVAKDPHRRAGENAFDGPAVGYPGKALITAGWIELDDEQPSATKTAAFDWGLECSTGCPNCRFKDAQVTPVVLDLPELLGGSDETAVEVIKRKLGINVFRGSIFDGPAAPAAQLQKHDAPAELKSYDCVLEKLTGADVATDVCGVECLKSQTATAATAPAACSETCTAASKTASVAVEAFVGPNPWTHPRATTPPTSDCSASNYALTPIATTDDVAAAGEMRSIPAPSGCVDVLRLSSPSLDELANKLEKEDLYAEADAVREVAQRLRVKARELKTGGAAAASRTRFVPASNSAAGCDCCKNHCGDNCKCSQSAASSEGHDSARWIQYHE